MSYTLFNLFIKMGSDREEAEDSVQEVFLRILKYRRTYKPSHSFSLWLYQIARRIWSDQFQKQRKNKPYSGEIMATSSGPLPGEKLEQKQNKDLLWHALAQLSESNREPLVLHRFQGLKYEEIAELLRCPIGTVKTRIHRALVELKKIITEISEK